MILILHPNTDKSGDDYVKLLERLAALEGITYRVHDVQGAQQLLTEVYLIGETRGLPIEDMRVLPCVERVVRVSEEYRILGRHRDAHGRGHDVLGEDRPSLAGRRRGALGDEQADAERRCEHCRARGRDHLP